MIPIKLEINNFMSYQGHHELDFTGFHTASIVGSNGSGKSAILDAITWVLFGEARRPKALTGNGTIKDRDEIINSNSQFCEITLELDIEGKRYLANRRIDRGKTGQALQFKLVTDAGEIDLHGKGGSDVEIERELGVSYEVFITSSFITQGDSSRFMDATPRERREVLSEILELDVYERCLETASELLKQARDEKRSAQEKQEELSGKAGKLPEVSENLTKAENELAKATASLESATKAKESAASEVARLEGTVRELEKDRQKASSLLAEKTKAEKDLADLMKSTSEASALLGEETTIEEGFRKLSQARKNRDRLNELATQDHELELGIGKLKAAVELAEGNLKKDLEQADRELSLARQSEADMPELERRLAEAKASLAHIEEAEKTLAGLDMDHMLAKKDHDLAKLALDQSMARLEEKLKILRLKSQNDAINELSGIQSLEVEHKTLSASIETQLHAIESEKLALQKAKTEGKHIKDEIKVLEDGETGNCPVCKSALEANRKDELLAEKSRLLGASEDQIKATETSLAKMQEQLDSSKKRLSEIQSRLSRKSDLEAAKVMIEECKTKESVFSDAKTVLDSSLANREEVMRKIDPILSSKAEANAELSSISGRLGNAIKLVESLGSLAKRRDDLKESLEKRQFATLESEEIGRLVEKRSNLGFDPAELMNARSSCIELERFDEMKSRLDKAKVHIEASRAAEIQLGSRISAIKEEIGALEERLSGLEELNGGLQLARSSLDQAKASEAKASGQRDECITRKTRLDVELKDIQAAITQASENEKLIIEKDKEAKIYEECKRMFGQDGIPSQILEGVVPELEEMANVVLSDISQGRIGSEGMHLEIKTKREGSQNKVYNALDIILTDGQIRRPYELFSGGERFRADFAVRIALSQLLAGRSGRKLRTLVIDEGFGTQDDEGIRRLIEAIQDVSAKFDKVLVISHVDEIKNAFEKRILVKRDSETSSFEVV